MIRPPAQPRYSQEQAAQANRSQVKASMLNDVIDMLYFHTKAHLTNVLVMLANDNNTAHGIKHGHLSFFYRGKYYNLHDDAAPCPSELHETLHERMQEYLAEYKQVYEYEIPVISGILKALFMASDRISDYKKVLPESVHGAFRFYCDPEPIQRVLQPAEIARMQKRIEPFLSVMKARLLQNLIQGQTP